MLAAFVDRGVYISFVQCDSLSNIRWKTRPLSDIHYNWFAAVWIRKLPRARFVCYYGTQVREDT